MTPPPRIALVGFMGSGKTTVGRLLAARLGFCFVDSDEEIESRSHAKIGEIFLGQGEAAFRTLEQEIIRDLLTQGGRVIATGGGAFVQPDCAEDLLDRAFTVHLSCDFEEAFRRVDGGDGRPLAGKGESEVRALYAERKDKYSRAHATVDTTTRSVDQVVIEVLRLLPHDR